MQGNVSRIPHPSNVLTRGNDDQFHALTKSPHLPSPWTARLNQTFSALIDKLQ